MNDWQEVQRKLYAMLLTYGKCFLRISRSQAALWVCDLPRSLESTALAEQDMKRLGVCSRLDEGTGLWLLDMEPGWYRALADSLPKTIPPLPKNRELHQAYALCRLLLLHPAPLERQPMEPVRGMLKWVSAAQRERKLLEMLHGQCAQGLRARSPLPTLCGQLLAQWILEQEG